MKFMFEYIRLILFAFGLLLGIQVPSFVDQYTKRVDAHLIEAQQSLSGFQQTADRYFSGSIEKLIAHYQVSDDPVFRNDADSIQSIYLRAQLLSDELTQLQSNAVVAAYHSLFNHQNALMQETLAQYSYVIMLSPGALLWGICLALVFALMIETLLRVIIRMLVKSTQRSVRS
jgi:hypothetical protein